MEEDLYYIMRAFQCSHCSNMDMKQLKIETPVSQIVYGRFLEYAKDFPRMWWSVRTLMEEI